MDKFRYTVQLENLINHYNGQTLESKFLCYFLTWFIWLSCSGDQKTTKTCKNLVPIKERHVLVSHSLSLFEIETSDSYIIRFQQNLRKTQRSEVEGQNFPLQCSERHRMKGKKQLLFYCCSDYYFCITYWRNLSYLTQVVTTSVTVTEIPAADSWVSHGLLSL